MPNKSKVFSFLFIVIITALLASPVFATIIRVPQDQPTIQAGINAAISGDTVLVSPGVYNENLRFSNIAVFLKSEKGTDSTFILLDGLGVAGIRFDSSVTTASIYGFTIEETGQSTDNYGCILIESGSIFLRQNIVKAKRWGIWLADNSLTKEADIDSCVIDGLNSGSGNFGIIAYTGTVNANNNIITKFHTGLDLAGPSQWDLKNNNIVNNINLGMFFSGSSATADMKNNIIAFNGAYGIYFESPHPISSDYNDVFGHTTANYFGVSPGVNDIQANPLFTDSISDFQLLNSSPCIDAGDPASPVPPNGGLRIDIGAIEYTNINPLIPLNGDTLIIRQPTFVWTRNSDTSVSTVYRVIIDTIIDFSFPDTSLPISDTIWKVPYPLTLGQHYYWRILGFTDSSDTIISHIRDFWVKPEMTLSNPENESRVLIKSPIFIWQTVSDTSIPDILSYQVYYAENPNFTNAISSSTIADTFWQVPTPLNIATTYYWKVLTFYSGALDTLQSSTFSFLIAPTTIVVPNDRPTIQQAIDIALSDDTVLVMPGTYLEHIQFRGKQIKLISEGGPSVTTISKLVDGVQLVDLSGTPDNAELSGFTLTGARSVSRGAAIKCESAYALIENCNIFDNTGDAGAVWINGAEPRLWRNLISNNSGEAAIRLFGGASIEVFNCTIANNNGDGIRFEPNMVINMRNNIVAFNSEYGVKSMGGANLIAEINYNDNFGNALGTYFGVVPATGNISTNPMFVGGNPFNYHLSSVSPCIDAGDPSFPVPPGGGARVDIGAFEFVPILGDLNGDGLFTPADVVLELNCVFLGTGNCNLTMSDLNCDSQLSPADVVLILNFVFLGIPLPC